ncbi:MAG: SdrD B-like domain-containing protein [Acidobacteriota bacterium]
MRSLTLALIVSIFIAAVPAAPALGQSDTLVEFFGHIPHTWDDDDPQTEDRVYLRGRLVEPAGAGPFPAVVVLHGSAGLWTTEPDPGDPASLGDMKSQFDDWAAMLTADGYVALILDSFGPRGYTTFQGKTPPEDADVAPVYERARDAYDALAYLRTLPNVDGERVALLGFSHGAGGVAGALADADAIEADMGTSFTVFSSTAPPPGTFSVPRPARPEPNESGFDCGVAYYPGASFFSYFGSGNDANDGYYRPYAPLRMIYGDLDSLWTVGHPEVLEDKALLAGSIDLVISLYEGSDHSFDTAGTADADDARLETRAVLADCLDGATAAGRLWADLDADGFEGGGEPPLEAVSVEITDGVDLWQTVTDASGDFRFEGLPAGTYTVSVDVPTDFSAVVIGSSAVDGQGDSSPVLIGQGESVENFHAPLWPAGTDGDIAGVVWRDDNGDGLFAVEESGLDGQEVRLETPAGTVLGTAVTDITGAFLFDGLLPGDYRLTLDAPGWQSSPAGFDSALVGDHFTGDISVAADQQVFADLGLFADCESFPLVAYGSEWAHRLDSAAPAGWETPGFDDGAWPRAHGLLGYPANQVHTELGTSTRVTRYFRHRFDLSDPTLVSDLQLEIERDDGAIVYLNGVEVLRSNLPGVVTDSTRAIDPEWLVESASVDPLLLQSGENVIAVELHQKWINPSPDWAFDLELRVTACEPCRVGTLDLVAEADTHLRPDSPAKAHGGWSSLWVAGSSGRAALLSFNFPGLPPGSEVLGADLVLDVTSDTTAYYPLRAAATDWQESAASWQVASDQAYWFGGDYSTDDLEGPTLGVAHVETGNGEYLLGMNAAGVTELELWLGGATHRGLVIDPGTSTSSDSLAVSSREGAEPPRLRIVYRDGSCSQ